jgi:8-oxo-dGTP pyrophosphatase MutT (NUDIX family)
MSTDRRRPRRQGDGDRGPVLREVSHGGVAVRIDDDARSAEVLVITPRNTRVTGLPKGGANPGETGEETAAREVREETGITVTVSERLGEVRYWYRRHGRRVQKTVHFYLCTFVEGSTDDHDDEVDDARWLPLEAARTQLTYPGEREMIERALSRLGQDR